MAILWRETMSVGVPVLDRDHKRLIHMTNAMETALSPFDEMVVRAVTQELMTYVGEHFTREEMLLERFHDPGLGRHKEHHAAAAEAIFLLRKRFLDAPPGEAKRDVGRQLYAMLSQWIVNHVTREDIIIRSFINPTAAGPMAHAPVAPPLASGPTSTIEAVRPSKPASLDVEYDLPPHLAHLLKRIEYDLPTLPPPERGFASFDALCEAAICRRVEAILVFFQRGNPDLVRELPPLFLASPEFAGKLRQVIRIFIMPEILRSRQLRLFAVHFEHGPVDAQGFWSRVGPQLIADLVERWGKAWDELRLVEKQKEDGTTVLQVKDPTRQMREMLKPDSADSYDMPRIGNAEIDIFRSLFQSDNELLVRLHRSWRKCHDLYEQELEPRVFQQRARDGAFRDILLLVLHELPGHWGEFLVLSCHRVFARVSTQFLERFSTNLARSEAEREIHLPYLMRYLRQVRDCPEIKRRERREEEEWQAQRRELQDIFRGVASRV